jgi:alanine dehydrogenase
MLFIRRAEVAELLDLDLLIDALAGFFIAVSRSETSVPPRVASQVTGKGFLGAMPAYVNGVLAAKLVTVFPGNHQSGVGSHQALVTLYDPDTGRLLAVMDGTEITALRTAAASALATRMLARQDVKTLTVIGSGVQAKAHLTAVLSVRSIDEIRVASRTREHAEVLAREFGGSVCADFEEATRGADVVCACTNSSTPVIRLEWLSAGCHVTSVGASIDGPELDAETIAASRVVVESRVALQPYPAGAHELQGLSPGDVTELGEILDGERPGRSSPTETTVYKSMGHAAEDACAASLVYAAARERGLGINVDL